MLVWSMFLLLLHFLHNRRVSIAHFRARSVLSIENRPVLLAQISAVESIEQNPDVVADEEKNVGKTGRAIERSVVHDLQKLEDGGHKSQHRRHISAYSPLSSDHFVLLIIHTGHVDSDGQNGIAQEGNPGEAVLVEQVRDLHRNEGIHMLLMTGTENPRSNASGLERWEGIERKRYRAESRRESGFHAFQNQSANEAISHHTHAVVSRVQIIHGLSVKPRQQLYEKRNAGKKSSNHN